MTRFQIGGKREPVFHFLRFRGWIMSAWSDKHWMRADGMQLHIYAVGSRARIYDKSENLVADDVIEDAVAKT